MRKISKEDIIIVIVTFILFLLLIVNYKIKVEIKNRNVEIVKLDNKLQQTKEKNIKKYGIKDILNIMSDEENLEIININSSNSSNNSNNGSETINIDFKFNDDDNFSMLSKMLLKLKSAPNCKNIKRVTIEKDKKYIVIINVDFVKNK